jgi:hypothetical protein
MGGGVAELRARLHKVLVGEAAHADFTAADFAAFDVDATFSDAAAGEEEAPSAIDLTSMDVEDV